MESIRISGVPETLYEDILSHLFLFAKCQVDPSESENELALLRDAEILLANLEEMRSSAKSQVEKVNNDSEELVSGISGISFDDIVRVSSQIDSCDQGEGSDSETRILLAGYFNDKNTYKKIHKNKIKNKSDNEEETSTVKARNLNLNEAREAYIRLLNAQNNNDSPPASMEAIGIYSSSAIYERALKSQDLFKEAHVCLTKGQMRMASKLASYPYKDRLLGLHPDTQFELPSQLPPWQFE